ncbi:unnamed protein product, partial [Ixodes persulcatus]
ESRSSLSCRAAEGRLLRCRMKPSPCGRRAPSSAKLSCVLQGASRPQPKRILEPGLKYLACVFGSCGPGCGICAPLRPGKKAGKSRHVFFTFYSVSFRAVEYSPFLVGLEWRRTMAASSASTSEPGAPASDTQRTVGRLGVTACWTRKHCSLTCGPEEAVSTSGSFGSYRLPVDLFRASVIFRVRAMTAPDPGTTLFKAAFHQKRLEPSAPCDVSVRTLGWSVVRVTWTSWPLRLDGFLA